MAAARAKRFLALRHRLPRPAPRELDASELLEGLTADDVREAADGVRRSLTPAESIEAVAPIVERRRRASVRVREEVAPYPAFTLPPADA